MPISKRRMIELARKGKQQRRSFASVSTSEIATPKGKSPTCPRCKSRMQKCPKCNSLSFRNNSIIQEWEDFCSLPKCKGTRLICAKCHKMV